MSLAQARLLLAAHRDRLNQVKQQLDALDTMVKTFEQVVHQRVAEMEGKLRSSSRDLAVIAGSGIQPDDILSMRNMYAAALENTDRVRMLGSSIRPMTEHTRNVRANLSVVGSAIERNVR